MIRAVVRKGISTYNHTIFGFRNGYQGLVDHRAMPLTLDSARGVLHPGWTILGTSRVDPVRGADGAERVKEAIEIHLLDGPREFLSGRRGLLRLTCHIPNGTRCPPYPLHPKDW